MYVDFVRQNILGPLGIDTNVVPTGPTPYTKYYNFLNGSFLPAQPADAYLRTGAGYWYLSVREYGKFIASLRNGDVLSPASWQTMRDNWLGLYHTNWPHGEYIDHNGGYTVNGAGSAGDWMGFPDGLTAVIYYNSQGGLPTPPQDIVRQAYEAAWQ
jgi:hypothetical protein